MKQFYFHLKSYFAGIFYLLALFYFPYLLTQYLQLPDNMLLNTAAKCGKSNVSGTIKKKIKCG